MALPYVAGDVNSLCRELTQILANCFKIRARSVGAIRG
jgi:hypothetical protein